MIDEKLETYKAIAQGCVEKAMPTSKKPKQVYTMGPEGLNLVLEAAVVYARPAD